MHNFITVSLDGSLVHELGSEGAPNETRWYEGYSYITGRVPGQPKFTDGNVNSYTVISSNGPIEYAVYDTPKGPDVRRLFRNVEDAFDFVAPEAA